MCIKIQTLLIVCICIFGDNNICMYLYLRLAIVKCVEVGVWENEYHLYSGIIDLLLLISIEFDFCMWWLKMGIQSDIKI
jgi:hypothetical protein